MVDNVSITVSGGFPALVLEMSMSSRELASVPLSTLVHSPKNVRKTRRPGGMTTEELADNILANGVLQNLVVHEQVKRGKATGQYEVDAGGNRLDALLLLLKQGRIAGDYDVPVSIGSVETATQVSLSENTHRVALHPADEFEAFQTLIDQGKSVADVAAIMGYSELTVARRLKLAAISPALMTLYREDGIGLDQLMALTLTDDHTEQEQVWSSAMSWDRTPAALRRALTKNEVNSATDPVAKFVGVDAYVEAGGAFRRDLFQDAGEGYLSDMVLLSRLAAETLAPVAADVKAEGWLWVEVSTDADPGVAYALRRLPITYRKPTKAEGRAISAAEKALAEAEDKYNAVEYEDGDDDDTLAAIEAACETARARLEDLRDTLREWTPDAMAVAGAVVAITADGTATVYRGLVRSEDKARAEKAFLDATETDPSDASQDAPKPEFSERLQRDLTAHRTAAIKAALAMNERVALEVLTHRLVLSLFGVGFGRSHLSAVQVTITDTRHALNDAAPSIPSSRAGLALDAARAAWEAKLPAEPEQLLSWLSSLSQEDLLALLAFCTASSIDTVSGPKTDRHVDDRARVLMGALDLDMADWWTPTRTTYFDHVAKAKALDVVTEAVSVQAAAEIAKFKKAPLSEAAERFVANTRWLPSVLRR